MCFSAGASFSASAALVVAGAIAIKEAKFTPKLAFAAIPLLFGVQQFAEGMLWTAMQIPGYEQWRQPATLLFLIIAKAVWPLWVPLSILLLEKKDFNRKILIGLTITGALLSAVELFFVLFLPVTATVDCRHIVYNNTAPDFISPYLTGFYLLVGILPPFVSSVKKTNLLGVVIVISLILAEL